MLTSTCIDIDVDGNVDVDIDIHVNIDIDMEGCNGGRWFGGRRARMQRMQWMWGINNTNNQLDVIDGRVKANYEAKQSEIMNY